MIFMDRGIAKPEIFRHPGVLIGDAPSGAYPSARRGEQDSLVLWHRLYRLPRHTATHTISSIAITMK